MHKMTVKKLREILSEAEPDAVVLISNGDHGYRGAYAEVKTALKEDTYNYIEDHGETYTPEAEYGTRVSAVVIG